MQNDVSHDGYAELSANDLSDDDTILINDRSAGRTGFTKKLPFGSLKRGASGSHILDIPFTFDSPGLLTGEFEAYTPKVGEYLMDAWFEVTEAWDGTTPRFGIGTFKNGATDNIINSYSSVNATNEWAVSRNPGILQAPNPEGGNALELGLVNQAAFPAKFTTAVPLCICVSQDGSPTGDDPGSAQGAAILHIVIGVGEAPFSVPEGTIAQLGAQLAIEPAFVAAIAEASNRTKIIAVPFAFDSPGLLIGEFEAYTPAVGEILEDAWIEVDEAWNGTTPRADIGTFKNGQTSGFWKAGDGAIPLVNPDVLLLGGSVLGNLNDLFTYNRSLAGSNAYTEFRAGAPGKFTTTDPLCICVSQDGTLTGGDPVSTQGSAILYLKISKVSDSFTLPEGTVPQLGAALAASLTTIRALVTAMLADATAQQRLSARYAEVGSVHVSKTGDEVIELLPARPYGRLIPKLLARATEAFDDGTGAQTVFSIGIDSDHESVASVAMGVMTGNAVGALISMPDDYNFVATVNASYLPANTALNVYKTGATGDGTGGCDIVVQAVAVL